jgi:hypothetical protein
LFGQAGNDRLIGNTENGAPDGKRDTLDGGAGNDVAKVSFKEAETLVGIESLEVFNPNFAEVFIRPDLVVMALEPDGTAWVNGVAEPVKARQMEMNSSGVLFILFNDNKLVKITPSGVRTTVAINVLEFYLDANGNPVITKIPTKPDPMFPEQP